MTKSSPVSENRITVVAALIRAEQALTPFENIAFTATGITTTLTQPQAVTALEALRLVRDALHGQGRPGPCVKPGVHG